MPSSASRKQSRIDLEAKEDGEIEEEIERLEERKAKQHQELENAIKKHHLELEKAINKHHQEIEKTLEELIRLEMLMGRRRGERGE